VLVATKPCQSDNTGAIVAHKYCFVGQSKFNGLQEGGQEVYIQHSYLMGWLFEKALNQPVHTFECLKRMFRKGELPPDSDEYRDVGNCGWC
jgi:hypothetical protein